MTTKDHKSLARPRVCPVPEAPEAGAGTAPEPLSPKQRGLVSWLLLPLLGWCEGIWWHISSLGSGLATMGLQVINDPDHHKSTALVSWEQFFF